MRKNYLIFSLLSLIGIMLTSCIKEEALNTEADIETAIIPENFIKIPTAIENDFITFYTKSNVDISKLAPTFTLTEGATIEPASGTERDFTIPQFYTVTSQDGAYKKTYKISAYTAEISTKFSFEETRLYTNGGFYEWIEKDGDKEAKIWDTGNSGYYISFMIDPKNRPDKDNIITTIEPNGKVGKGVKLITQKPGKMGMSFAPLAAGNLFTGEFETNIFAPKESPKFGTTWDKNKVPSKLIGYFKYKAGKEFETNSDTPSELEIDTFDIYAVFLEKTNEKDYLKATHGFNFIEDPDSDPRVISYARIKQEDRIETDEWTAFELPFITIANRQIDPNKEYMLAIVITSSLEGGDYNGAVGSTLSIDEIEVLTDKIIDNNK